MAAKSETRQGKSKALAPVIEAALAEANGAQAQNGNGKAPSELHELWHALQAMRVGDFSVRMAPDHEGIAGKIAETFNEIVAANQRMAKELERVGEVVGREGKTRHRVKFGLSSGAWGEMESSVNTLIDDLLWPTKEVTTAVAAVAQSDLLKTVRLEVDGRPLKGEFLEAASIVHKTRQLEQLNSELEQRVAERTAELEASTARLLDSEQQLRLATDAAEVGLWDLDLITDTLFWPPRVKAMFGISPDVPVTMADFFAGLHPDDRETTVSAFTAACDPDKRALYDVEYRTVGKEDGVVRWVAAKGRAIFDGNGKCVRVLGTALDITKRKQAEERQMLLAREVDHRARNALAVVQAIVRLTRATNAPSYVAAVEGRIRALAQAHTLLSQSRWQGADIVRLIDEELAPYRGGTGTRVKLSGESTVLEPDKAQTLALALHELATNSAKYGALSTSDGALEVGWKTEGGVVLLRWRETGGPPVRPPTEHGFGTKIINASIKHQMGGDVVLDWRPEGLQCTLSIPCPVADGQTTAAAAQTPSNLVQLGTGGRKRIILVEDEALVGMMMRDMLVDLGYFVVGPFCSVPEARSALESQHFDCAILDLNLSGEMVYPIADLLQNRRIPFMFATGYGSESIDRRYAHVSVIQKPIAPELLDMIVRNQLERSSRSIEHGAYEMRPAGDATAPDAAFGA